MSETTARQWTQEDFLVEDLGERQFDSTLDYCKDLGKQKSTVLINDPIYSMHGSSIRMELPLPTRKVYFDAKQCTAAIVTCGGLCPGMNDVIRALVNSLQYTYGVKKILGLRYGFQGLTESENPNHQPLVISAEKPPVYGCQNFGGTVLGTSRGPQKLESMVSFVKAQKIDILFAIGGDGTMKGVNALGEALKADGCKVALVGIPKTIDNDIMFTDRTFGFETAVQEARQVICCAHTEAHSHEGGVGLVKLMGRESGFVAAVACIASGEANLCLIPEMPFTLEKVNALVEQRIRTRSHCLIVVAEGAGQDILGRSGETDASGNAVLGDIGLLLKDSISKHLKKAGLTHTVKYFDPSYSVRSSPANVGDALYCCGLAKAAVHAAMSGKTNMLVTMLSNRIVCLPTKAVTNGRKQVYIHGNVYQHLLETTGMPTCLV